MLALSLPALVLFFPWLIKNTLSTGNPIYPLLFPSGAMTTLRLDAYQNIPRWGNWQDIVFLPFRATYKGFDKSSGYGMSIGPLLLALGALAWIGSNRRTKDQRITLQNAAVVAIAGIIIWLLAARRAVPSSRHATISHCSLPSWCWLLQDMMPSQISNCRPCVWSA